MFDIMKPGIHRAPVTKCAYVCVSMSNTHHTVKSHHGPCLYVMKGFETKEEACDWVQGPGKEEKYPVYLIQAHQMFLIGKNATLQTDENYLQKVIQSKIQDYTQAEKDKADIFSNRIRADQEENTVNGQSSFSDPSNLNQTDTFQETANSHDSQSTSSEDISAFTVVNFLNPKDPEVVTSVYGVFSTYSDAEKYTKNVLVLQYKYLDFYIAECNKWLSPQQISSYKGISTVYRNNTLNEIIQDHQRQAEVITGLEHPEGDNLEL